jgi:hypothetical protein
MPHAVSRLPVTAEAWVRGSVHVGYAADEVALGQVFIRILWLSPVSVIPPRLSILIYHLENEQ